MDKTVEEGKTMAIVSYLTIIGCIIALVMNSEKKNYFSSFHIRQALGTILLFFILGYPIGYFNSWMISSAFYIFFFIIWVYGFLGAVQGKTYLVPVVGPFFQKTFKNL
ncbi:MAG: hypothetical protein BM557_07150 [Flavobacterium sp. MedPE-SWcel]|uniref:DUF4870 domain-containing protein n=1 Tax=uncultured Flavobacterium sp. TaxID=165435 RepID=UPI000910C022|nr:hypothetical protein [uncultured Flavobacterium sp.]OIQ18690.1 MAG: hypothetical protein BM557_07150 [Flavobacterium sp. MedPE-SWcel]